MTKSNSKPKTRAISEQDKLERRHLILQAALGVFFDKGFQATRMEDIANQAGFSKGTLYLYFNSKPDLFLALIEDVAIPNIERLEQQVADVKHIEHFLELLFDFANQVIRHSKLPRLIKVLISDAQTFPDIIQTYREHVIKRMLRLLSTLLKQAAERGEIYISDPLMTARLMVAPVVFSMLWVVIFEKGDDQPLDLPALLAEHHRMLKCGLGIKDETHAIQKENGI